MLSITNLNKAYGEQILFKDAEFCVNSGERVGLIGKNGYGKSTLFKIIAKEESADANIIVPKNYSISYLKQNINFEHKTVIDECLSLIDDPNDEWQAKKILYGLGFKEFIDINPYQLSGGFQVRLNLAKLLISKNNMLLLDEPNNYLDINSIRWLEGFLKSFNGEIVLITHDRAFMDSVVTHIAGINRFKIKKTTGTTSKYYSLVNQEDEVHEKTRLNQEKKIKQAQEFIDKFRAKARQANMVQSRIKALEKAKPLEKLSQAKNLDFKFKELSFTGRYTLNIKNLNFGYEEDKILIKNLDFHTLYGEKICVIGKNGKGKTSLLKIINKLILNHKSDEFIIHPNTVIGYYEQTNVSSLNPDSTVLDEVLYSAKDLELQSARNICGLMMFEGDNALKKISVLSGGEKCRVLLAKILASPCNFLLLDEPTNHLDMDSCNSFMEAIRVFKGTVIMVTHNEFFLKELAEKLIVFKDDETLFFENTYEDFLNKIGWEDEFQKVKSKHNKNFKKEKAKIIQEKSKILNPLQADINKIETNILEYEKLLEKISEDLLNASYNNNSELIIDLNKKILNINENLKSLYEALDPILNKFDILKKEFDNKLLEFK